MSYCRFQNTLQDLQDCFDEIQENETNLTAFVKDLGHDEKNALRGMVDLVADFKEWEAELIEELY
jgi:hypothetical protein